ncbi:protein kinase [Candidatus Uabimicrobium sp. HlEnr_7]|uniref:serine/threonine-protein kinase n=1 Tax=Candidatus Uabimicrobium helgolandensis TaxID=3095367 RepID=UPI0035579D7B
MLTAEQKKFVLFCIENSFFSRKDAQQLQENITQYPQASFAQILAQTLSCSMPQIQKMREAYLEQDHSHKNTMPMYLMNDYKWAQEVFGRGLTDLKNINSILSEKYQNNDERDFLQILLAHRVINTKNFLLIQKEVSTDKWKGTPSELEIRSKDHSYFFERKSTAKVLGQYKIIRELGRGGMGVVYEGYDSKLDRTVAIKTMISNLAGEEQKERFLREAKLIASLKHPGITQIYEIGVEEDVIFFAMDYIEGLSLLEYIEVMQLDIRQKIELIVRITDALAFAHQQGVIHRDIKPENILIDSNGKPYLMDFGLAKRTKGSEVLTMSGATLGTPQYMSPEQVEGKKNKIKKTSDIFSFGIVLYEVLVGKPPFTATNIQAIFAAIAVKDPIAPRKLITDLPKDLETICMKCLQKSPSKRYPNAKALYNDLQNFLQGQHIKAKPISISAKAVRWVQRNKSIFSLVCVLMASIIILSYQFIFAPGTLYLSLKGGGQNFSPNVFIDGEYFPAQKAYSLANGYHEVMIKHPNYQTLQFTIKVAPGEEINVEKQLSRVQGKITLESSVSGVQVTCIHQKTQEKFSFFAPVYKYEIPKGNYLFIFQKDNYFTQKRNLRISPDEKLNIEIDLQPMLVWKKEFTEKVHDVVAADIDNNNRTELYVTKDEGSITSYDIFSHEEMWSYKTKMRSVTRVDFHDINKDGLLDIMYIAKNDFTVLDGKTFEEVFVESSWWGGLYGFYDENKDGYDDIILANHYHGIRCIDSQSGKELWRVQIPKINGGLISRLHFINKHSFVYRTAKQVFVFDLLRKKSRKILDAENTSFLVNKIGNKNLILSNEKGVFSVNPVSFSIKWIWKNTSNLIPQLQLCDIDQDGEIEILIAVDFLYCVNPQSGDIKWKSPQNYALKRKFPPVVVDLDKDKKNEIILAGDNKVLILDDKGKKLNELKFSNKLRKVETADVSGDGFLEIICLLEKNIYAMKPIKTYKKTYNKDLFLRQGGLITTQVNQDKIHDIILSNNLGDIYCLDGNNFQKIWHKKLAERTPIYLQNSTVKKQIVFAHKEKISFYDLQGNFQKNLELSPYTQSTELQFVDLNNDQIPEILYPFNGNIYCFSDGKLQWKKPFPLSHGVLEFLDINGDNVKDIIAVSESKDKLGYSFVVCFEGGSGRVLWQAPLLRPGGDRLGAVVAQGSSGPLLFICQHAGAISHIDYRSGRVIWQKQLTMSSIINHVQVGNFDGERGDEVIAFGDDAEIVSLDVRSGKQNWMIFSEKSFHNRSFNSFILDIDKDGSRDLVTTINFSKFHIFNLKTGKHLWSTNEATIQGRSHFVKNEQNYDFIAMTANSQIIKIESIEEYLQRSFQKNVIYSKYQTHHAIDSSYKEHNDLVRIVDSVKNAQYNYASSQIKAYKEKYPRTFHAKFLQLIMSLNGELPDASSMAEQLLKRSVWDFEYCWQQYADLITAEGSGRLHHLLSVIAPRQNYAKKLVRSYENAIFINSRRQQQDLLALSLKYGSKKIDPDYEQRRKKYLSEVRVKIERNFTLYRRHKGYHILERAFTILHEDKDLYLEKIYLALDRRNYVEVSKAANKILKQHPQNITAHTSYVISEILQQRYSRALKHLESKKAVFAKQKQKHVRYIHQFLTLIAKRDKKTAAKLFKEKLDKLKVQKVWHYSLPHLFYR